MMLENIHLIGSSSLPVAPLIDWGRDHSLAAWKENRFGPSGWACAFWTPSNSVANGRFRRRPSGLVSVQIVEGDQHAATAGMSAIYKICRRKAPLLL
jgi:hypothetical protein